RRVVHPRLRVPRVPPVHASDEAKAAGPPGGGGPDEADAGGLCDAAQGGAGTMGPADVASAAGTAGPNDTTDPPTRRALAARSPIRFAVRRAEGAFLPLPPVLFLVLEPRQKSRRGAEG